MTTYKHIICILTAIVSLIACSEAELEKLPYGTVSINATWSGDHPVYEVKIDEEAPLEVKGISIFENFTDNNYFQRYYYTDKETHRWINVKEPKAPYIIDDKYWTAYGNDLFEAYAKVTTTTGTFISPKVSITYPTDNIIRIKNTEYVRYGDFSKLTLEGENFDMKGSYKIGDTPVKFNDWESTPNKLVIADYLAPQSGLINETLVVNGKEYPFTFDYPVARIDNISKTEIEIGDTISVSLKDCKKYFEYAFRNCSVIKKDDEKQRYTLLPICTKSTELDITPYDPEAGIASYEKIYIKANTQTEWSKISEFPCHISFIYDNKIYSHNNHKISVYDIKDGNMLNTYKWNCDYSDTYVRGICGSKDYIYIAYNLDYFNPKQSYIDRINMVSGKTERVCEISDDISRAEYDGSDLFTWSKSSDIIYKINPSTGKQTKLQEPTHFDYSTMTLYNGYVYGSTYSMTQIYRYKIGDKTSELLYKNENFHQYDNLLKIKEEWMFHYKSIDDAVFFYKTKLDSKNPSKIETKNMGCFKPKFNYYIKQLHLHIDGGYYYLFVTDDTNKTIMYRTPEK